MLQVGAKRLIALCVTYATLIVVYLLQVLLVAPDKETLAKYHIDASQLKILALTIAIPYIVIWVISFIGYLRLASYVTLIEKDRDGAAFKIIAQGVLLLSLWLPISTILASFFRQYYHSHPEATANLVRLDNYVNLIILFTAFWLINRGAHKLLPLVKKTNFSISQALVLAYIAFAALYVWLTLHDTARQFPTDAVPVASYYLPDWLLIFTLIIPRLLYWFMGAQAVRNIHLYRQKVKGTLYQQALNNLAIGLAAVVGMTVVLRCLQSLSGSLQQLSLGLLLGVVYLLLALISVGFIFIAKGAEKLQRLEES